MNSPLQDFKAKQHAEAIAKQTAGPAGVAGSTVNKSRTFVHQVAGANTIMPDGTKLSFYGKTTMASKGISAGFGYYTTDREHEITWLASIAKMQGSQVTELISDPVTHTEKLVPKPVDPTIQEAADDAAENTSKAMDPGATAAAASLGKVIANS